MIETKSRETTVHQLIIDKEYAKLYPDEFSDNRYISKYWRKYNRIAREKERQRKNDTH